MKNSIMTWILTVGLFLISELTQAQCSMCRAVVETDISGKGAGINNGIVYLMAFPYVLVALIAFGIFYKMRKDSQQEVA